MPDGYVEGVNLHPDPKRFIAVDPVLLASLKPLALVHSHTNGNASPSSADMQSQIDTAIPWGIVVTDGVGCSDPFWWGDTVEIEPLVGRKFRAGVHDCYSLIRDHYRIDRHINLPDFPRDALWWQSGKNLYLENFSKAGFVEIPIEKIDLHDVVLMRLLAPVPNHGGVITETGLLLHHLSHRLSAREPFGPWRKKVSHTLRYRP